MPRLSRRLCRTDGGVRERGGSGRYRRVGARAGLRVTGTRERESSTCVYTLLGSKGLVLWKYLTHLSAPATTSPADELGSSNQEIGRVESIQYRTTCPFETQVDCNLQSVPVTSWPAGYKAQRSQIRLQPPERPTTIQKRPRRHTRRQDSGLREHSWRLAWSGIDVKVPTFHGLRLALSSLCRNHGARCVDAAARRLARSGGAVAVPAGTPCGPAGGLTTHAVRWHVWRRRQQGRWRRRTGLRS
mmetsp:Transcript_73350/g.220352  ORF Transcript_73350/g.220352 Transcript_73350/m.220352 type:complete len:244 (+) Transcript_73350:1029-1760(+)